MRVRPEPQEWYFFKAGSNAGLKAGPFSWDGLLQQADKGTLEPTDVVWDPTSGWQTAAKVSGLFPDAKTSEVVDSGLESILPPPYEDGGGGRWRYYLVGALVALAIIGAGVGVYLGVFYDRGDEVVTTESTSTTEASVSSTTGSTTESTTQTTLLVTTTTLADDGTPGDEPDVLLGKRESGHQVFLRPGETVRIELEPYVGDRVKEVRWTYAPNEPDSVREIGSGENVIENIVVDCWLELEAVEKGPVTVRAEYVYPNGTSRALWVIYLFVIDG